MNTILATDYPNDAPHEATGVRVAKRVIKGIIALTFIGAMSILLSNWWVVYDTRNQSLFQHR